MKVSYEEAVRTTSRNKLSKFPDRRSGRLEPVANPSFDCGITLEPGARVMTMGSCFARNIEEYLGPEGYDVPVLGFTVPTKEAGDRERPQGILNKYTVASIYQEVKWCHEVMEAGGVVTWELVEAMAYESSPALFLDLQLATHYPVPRERFLERRQQIFETHKLCFDCDLFIITPGLTEAWFDEKTGMYMQYMPDKNMASANPGRFSFVNLDFHQCYTMLKECAALLLARGTKQIAFTVSPVPLARTMTDQDILIANTYSKSTIRSAVGFLIQQDFRLKYVPSYERVALTKSPSVWEDDLRHVTGDFVGTIVASFADGTGRPLGDIHQMVDNFNKSFEDKKLNVAITILDQIGNRSTSILLPKFHQYAAAATLKVNRLSDSLRHAEILRVLRPNKGVGYIKAAEALRRMNKLNEARAMLEDAKARCDKASQQWIADAIARQPLDRSRRYWSLLPFKGGRRQP